MMEAIKTTPRKYLFILSVAGFLVSAGVHGAALQNTDLMARYPWLIALQAVGILSFIGLILLWAVEKRPRTYFQDVVVNRVWPFACILPIAGYAIFNVVTNTPLGGYFAERDGEFVRLNHGAVLETYPTREAYDAAMAASELLGTTAYSAQWIAFFGVVAIVLLAEKTRGNAGSET